MAGVTCPNCNAVASSSEIAAGWCDSCGKKIPTSYTAAAHSPNRTARDALMTASAPKAMRGRKRIIGTLIAAGIGAVVAAVVMAWPLREAGYILMLMVAFAIMLAAISVGQIADGMLVGERK